MAGAGLDRPKQFLLFDGFPLYWHSARTFGRVAGIHGLVVVFPPSMLDDAGRRLRELVAGERFPLPVRAVAGGRERQDSVRLALAALPAECDAVLVHDAARPFMTARLAAAVLHALREGREAVIPGVPPADTMKRLGEDGFVRATLARDTLRAIQTPQGFSRAALAKAHDAALARSLAVTDDAALMEEAGIPVAVIPGDTDNVKITNPADLAGIAAGKTEPSRAAPVPRTGFGYDVHAYGGNRPLVLGGVPIPGTITVSAHSDGDTLLHALIDAILGCLGRGDIGVLFPDADAALAGIESGILLSETMSLAARDGFAVVHADMTIVAQTPEIGPYRERIAGNIAKMLHLERQAVNIKATTEEHLGFTGEKKGIKCYAVVTGIARRGKDNGESNNKDGT